MNDIPDPRQLRGKGWLRLVPREPTYRTAHLLRCCQWPSATIPNFLQTLWAWWLVGANSWTCWRSLVVRGWPSGCRTYRLHETPTSRTWRRSLTMDSCTSVWPGRCLPTPSCSSGTATSWPHVSAYRNYEMMLLSEVKHFSLLIHTFEVKFLDFHIPLLTSKFKRFKMYLVPTS